MNNMLQFDFSVNKENKTIHVTRAFNANLNLVWEAWTKAELLDQWWAPKPWKAETKIMDFTEGGKWLYAMVGPEGERHFSLASFKKIEAHKSFSAESAFSDEDGNTNLNTPTSNWNNQFTQNTNTTTVNITLSFDKLEDLETLIAMGFKEGFTMGLGNLDDLLAQLSV